MSEHRLRYKPFFYKKVSDYKPSGELARSGMSRSSIMEISKAKFGVDVCSLNTEQVHKLVEHVFDKTGDVILKKVNYMRQESGVPMVARPKLSESTHKVWKLGNTK